MERPPRIESLDDVLICVSHLKKIGGVGIGDPSMHIVIGDYKGPDYRSVAYEEKRGFCLIDGELAYLAVTPEIKWLVNIGGEEGKKYANISCLQNIYGKFTYIASITDHQELVVHGEKEGRKYCNIKKPLIEFSGELAYIAKTSNGEVVVLGDEEISDPELIKRIKNKMSKIDS